MEEIRGITVKVRGSLHARAKQETESNEQTMSQFIEKVLEFYFTKGAGKEMGGNKKTLAFQVSEEFYEKVHGYINANDMTLKDFGIASMCRMMEGTPAGDPGEAPIPAQE